MQPEEVSLREHDLSVCVEYSFHEYIVDFYHVNTTTRTTGCLRIGIQHGHIWRQKLYFRPFLSNIVSILNFNLLCLIIQY